MDRFTKEQKELLFGLKWSLDNGCFNRKNLLDKKHKKYVYLLVQEFSKFGLYRNTGCGFDITGIGCGLEPSDCICDAKWLVDLLDETANFLSKWGSVYKESLTTEFVDVDGNIIEGLTEDCIDYDTPVTWDE